MDHFLDSRAEICQIFRWVFGKSMTPKRDSEINWPLIHIWFLKIGKSLAQIRKQANTVIILFKYIPGIWRNLPNYKVPDFLKNFIWKTEKTAKVVLIFNLVGNQRKCSFLKHYNNKLITRPHPKTSWNYQHEFILAKTTKRFQIS